MSKEKSSDLERKCINIIIGRTVGSKPFLYWFKDYFLLYQSTQPGVSYV